MIQDGGARKGRKVAKHCVFPMVCGSGGSKSRLAKAAGAEPAVQMRDAFSVADAVQETCSSEMLGGEGADFLREVAFWSIRSSVLGR